MNENTALEKVNWDVEFQRYTPDIKSLLPKSLGIDEERFLTSAWNVLQVVPKITLCEPFDVFAEIKNAAMVGLDPNTGMHECAIVVFKDSRSRTGYKPVLQIEKQGRLKLGERAKIKVDRTVIWASDTFRYHIDLDTQWVVVDEYVPGDEKAAYDVAYFVGVWVTHLYVTSGIRRHFYYTRRRLDSRVPPNGKARSQNPLWSGADSWKMYSKTAIHESFRDFVPMTEGERALAIADQIEVTRDEIAPALTQLPEKATPPKPRTLRDDLIPTTEPSSDQTGDELFPSDNEEPKANTEHTPSFVLEDKVFVNMKKVIVTLNAGETQLQGVVKAEKNLENQYGVILTNGTIQYEEGGKSKTKVLCWSSELSSSE